MTVLPLWCDVCQKCRPDAIRRAEGPRCPDCYRLLVTVFVTREEWTVAIDLSRMLRILE